MLQLVKINIINPDKKSGDRGDKWAFVSLEASAFADMKEWEIALGEAFPLVIVNEYLI